MNLYTLSDRIVFNILNDIDYGFLEIVNYEGKLFKFGKRDTSLKASLKIKKPNFTFNLIKGGSVGFAESYMKNEFETKNLSDLIEVTARNIKQVHKFSGLFDISFFNNLKRLFVNNTKNKSKENISKHYDLGNDFFQSWLDEKMMYSCAIFDKQDCGLEKASTIKLDRICKKLRLNENDHLLEIGTGWGGFAIYAAKNYGCKVTTTTISEKQYQLAKERVGEANLSDKITVLLEDYRDLEGQFDKLVSIEMIEAVGHQYFDDYFKKCSKLLKPDGLMVLQAITIADQQYEY